MKEETEKELPSIFLSYSWDDFEIANKIDKDFSQVGISLVRDVKEMEYKDSISSFMKKIKGNDYALLLISNSYLKSANCMREVLEILKDDNFSHKILPIILPKTKIFDPIEEIEFIKYWQEKIEKLNFEIKNLVSITHNTSLISELEHYQEIRNSINSFIKKIKDLNCKSFDEIREKNYHQILNHIGFSTEDFISVFLETSKIKSLTKRDFEVDKLLEKHPNNSKLFFLKAFIAIEEEKYDKAINILNKLTKDEKQRPTAFALCFLGICYNFKNNTEKAIEFYKKAIEIDEHCVDAHNDLARILLQKNDIINAKKHHLKSLEVNPHNFASHFGYSGFLIETKEYLLAENHLKKSISLFTQEITNKLKAGIYYSLAHLYQTNLFEFEKAEENYLKSIELDNTKFTAHCNLATTYKNNLKQYEKAIYHFKESLKINPKDSITLNNIGNLYLHELKKNDLAEDHYLRALDFSDNTIPHLVSSEINACSKLGLIYFDKSPPKSKKYLKKALDLDANSATNHYYFARLLKLKFKEDELAKKHYLKSIELDPKFFNLMDCQLFEIKTHVINLALSK